MTDRERSVALDQLRPVLLGELLVGGGNGCAGCRLVCEVIPLLNDYGVEANGGCRLIVHLEEGKDDGCDLPWRIVVRDEEEGYIGRFELYSTVGKTSSHPCVKWRF